MRLARECGTNALAIPYLSLVGHNRRVPGFTFSVSVARTNVTRREHIPDPVNLSPCKLK